MPSARREHVRKHGDSKQWPRRPTHPTFLFSMEQLFYLIGVAVYAGQGVVALWGGFSAVLAWRRAAQLQFRNELQQDEFLDELEEQLVNGRVDAAIELCEDDRRALPQLALDAIEMREMEFPKLKRRLTERFESDVLADLEHRLNWVGTVIKVAPMLGLFGTVIGMMGAFANLGSGTKVDQAALAIDIFFALITTAIGLATAMPLLVCAAAVNMRIRKMEDMVSSGLTRLLDTMQVVNRAVRSR
jgi:biopolymer transport protein ExbB